MKFVINQSPDIKETEIIINCSVIDENLNNIINMIRLSSFSIAGRKNGESFNISLDKIYYFESIDDKTFIYLKNDVYETDMKLYEIEQLVSESRFVRINKSSILNLEKLLSIKTHINGRYEATLKNNEKMIITRHYVESFKEKFNL